MIVEALITGSSLVGCAVCWATVQKHRLSVELQKHKITVDYESIKPMPEREPPPKEPTVSQQVLDAQKKSLDALLERRTTLEEHISNIRNTLANGQYSDKKYDEWRVAALKTLEDARTEQQELVLEEVGLLEMMQGGKRGEKDSTAEPVRVDTGDALAESLDDTRSLHITELYDEETSRKSCT